MLRRDKAAPPALSVALEELNGALVLFRGGARGEGAEIATLPRFWVLLPRIETVTAGFEFADHGAAPIKGTVA